MRDGLAFLLPRAERLEELHDLVALARADVVDAHGAHLDVVVEQEVEQPEEAIEAVVVRTGRESRVRDRRGSRLALDVLCQTKQRQSAAEGFVGVGNLQLVRQMGVCPLDQTSIDGGGLYMVYG